MYIYICIHICVSCITCVYIYIYICTYNMSICIYNTLKTEVAGAPREAAGEAEGGQCA